MKIDLTHSVETMSRNIVRKHLLNRLTSEELAMLSGSFDIVSDIAIIKVPKSLEGREMLIAEAVMSANRCVKTVLKQVSPVSGELRTRRLEWVAGENKTEATYRESGCSFRVDLSEVYFSPRLSFERMRIARLVRGGEVVVNMFAGVGCFSIIAVRHGVASKVYSIDINPRAVELMRENIALNRVEGKVEAFLGDAREVVETAFRGVAHRVLMPLPEKACEYLDAACLALRPGGGFIHYYDFVHAKKKEDAIEKAADKVRERMNSLRRNFEVASSRVIRTVGPNWSQVVLDLYVS